MFRLLQLFVVGWVWLAASCGGGGGGQILNLNLSATSNSATSVELSWSDLSTIPGITFATIYRALPGGAYTAVHNPSLSTTSWVDTGLTPSTWYSYYMTVAYESGSTQEGRSQTVFVRTLEVVNNAPSGLFASYISSTNSIRLIWQDNSETETGFQVEKSVDGGSATLLPPVGANTTLYTDSNIVIGSTYYYRVRATLSGGLTTPASSTIEFPVTVGQLVAPSGLRGVVQSSSSVLLTWIDNSTNESGFEVHRAVTGTSVFTLAQTTAAGATSVVDSGLSAANSYTYRLRAVASGRISPFTNILTVSTGTPGVLAPTNLQSSYINSATVRLSWDDNSANESGFEIERVFPTTSTPIAVEPNTTSYDFSVATSPGSCTDAIHEVFPSIFAVDLDSSRMSMALNGSGYVISSGSAIYITPSANFLPLSDESAVTINLPFSFPYPGGTTSSLNINSNGYITTGTSYLSYSPSTTNFQDWPTPMWAVCWHDFEPNDLGPVGGVILDSSPSVVTVTWNAVRTYLNSSTTSTFQVQFRPNGQVDYVWRSVGNGAGGFSSAALIGFKPPGTVIDPGSRDLSVAVPAGVTLCGATASGSALFTNTTYGFRVRATTGTSFSPYTPANYLAMPNLPAPRGLSVIQLQGSGSNALRLAWQDNSNFESAFEVEYSVDGQYFVPLQPIYFANTTSATVNAPFMRRNWFRVAALSLYGVSGRTSYSEPVSIILQ